MKGKKKKRSNQDKTTPKGKKSTIHAVYDVKEVKGPKECLRPVVVEEERKKPSLNSNEETRLSNER